MIPKYVKQILTTLKAKVDKSTVIVWNLNTCLSITDRQTNRQNQEAYRRFRCNN